MDYDVLIVGAGPGGIFTAYELTRDSGRAMKIAVYELGESQKLYPVQNLLNHEWVRRCRCFFGWKIQPDQ